MPREYIFRAGTGVGIELVKEQVNDIITQLFSTV